MVEVDETRVPSSLAVIGHVGSGKSTICGSIMFHMGIIDKRDAEKLKKEAEDSGRDSCWFSKIMDDSIDEKTKDKTIEIGRFSFNTKSKRYTIFDTPGHKNFVPNMIMGAACADIAGLVISARRGEFETGFDR